MSTTYTENCANCGKEGLNICNKCKMVKYCNAACKKKHRSRHKKQCQRRVAEIYVQKLFKQPPPKEECPICYLPLPTMETGHKYMACCGKSYCSGCIYAVYGSGKDFTAVKCPICRGTVPKSGEEVIQRYKKREEVGDAGAIYNLGCHYNHGRLGLPQNQTKACELWLKAGELGHDGAYSSLASAYWHGGRGVEKDTKKGLHYWELAAMGGNAEARFNIGYLEMRNIMTGNINDPNADRALRHFMIAVREGEENSLHCIRTLYSIGYATKDDYENALRERQSYLDNIKSVQRDKAAAYTDDYKYL